MVTDCIILDVALLPYPVARFSDTRETHKRVSLYTGRLNVVVLPDPAWMTSQLLPFLYYLVQAYPTAKP